MATNITVITGSGTTTYTVNVDRRGPVGPAGEGTNAITSATTSDGTAALYLDSIRFETTNGGPTQTGEMAWESTDGSIDAMLESGVVVAMGEDLLIRVRNATASPIAKGAALAYDGTQGASGRLEVKPWVGSNIPTAKLFLGFAAAAIPANSNGYAQWFGKLDGINTSGGAENWQDEQIIYAVPGTSATLTNVAPTSGEYAVVAVVINAGSGTSGILYVRPTFEKFPVSADITDATSDGQTNPGKLLKTDANGALQIEELTLGNSTIGTNGGLRVVGTNNTATIYNSSDTSAALAFGSTSGTIMVGANNLSEISSASTARTALGSGTVGDSLFTAATVAAARSQLGITSVIKSADETRTNTATTYSADTHLSLSLNADTNYKIIAHIFITTGACGIRLRFSHPQNHLNAAAATKGVYYPTNPTAFNGVSGTVVGQITGLTGRTNELIPIEFHLRTGVSGGNLVFEWNQNTNDPATSATVHQYSKITAIEI